MYLVVCVHRMVVQLRVVCFFFRRGPRSGTSLGMRGAVLVFLPGLPEIKEMDSILEKTLQDAQYVRVLPVHCAVCSVAGHSSSTFSRIAVLCEAVHLC